MDYSKLKKSELIELLDTQDEEIKELRKQVFDLEKQVEDLEYDLETEYTANEDLEDHEEALEVISRLREAKSRMEFSDYEKEEFNRLIEALWIS